MILFIDEEAMFTRVFRESLESAGYKVELRKTVDEAFDYLQKRKQEINLLIVDIMMPPGKRYAKIDTSNGRRTGVFLLEDIRKIAPTVPIIVLTAIADLKLIESLNKIHNCRVLRKVEILPAELVSEVRQRL